MLTNLFARLFHRRCPLCKREVRELGDLAVYRLGKWCCSEIHADCYESELYEALKAVYYHHVGCHAAHVPGTEATSPGCLREPTTEVVAGEKHGQRH
jgi:hypothetical protein